MSAPRYNITLSCLGVPEREGRAGLPYVREELMRRSWLTNVECLWKDGRLILKAKSENDPKAEALRDEFSDVVCACIEGTFGFSIVVDSIARTEGTA